MLKILTSIAIPFLLAGSINNISIKNKVITEPTAYSTTIVNRDFEFSDFGLGADEYTNEFAYLEEFGNTSSYYVDLFDSYFTGLEDGVSEKEYSYDHWDKGRKYLKYNDEYLTTGCIEYHVNMDFSNRTNNNITFALDSNVLYQLELWDYINSKLPDNSYLEMPYLYFNETCVMSLIFDSSMKHVQIDSNGFDIAIVKNENNESFYRLNLNIPGRLDTISYKKIGTFPDYPSLDYSSYLFEYKIEDNKVKLKPFTEYQLIKITDFNYNVGSLPDVKYEKYWHGDSIDFVLKRMTFNYKIDGIDKGSFLLNVNYNYNEPNEEGIETGNIEVLSLLNITGNINNDFANAKKSVSIQLENISMNYLEDDSFVPSYYNIDKTKFQYSINETYRVFYSYVGYYRRSTNYFQWLVGYKGQQFIGVNCYFDEAKTKKIYNIYAFHLKYELVNGKKDAFTFTYDENDTSTESVEIHKNPKFKMAKFSYVNSMKDDHGLAYGSSIDDEGRFYDNYIINYDGYGGNAFKQVDPLEIRYKTTEGTWTTGVSNSQGLHVDQATGIVYDIEGNAHSEYKTYTDSSGYMYPSTDGTVTGIVKGDNVEHNHMVTDTDKLTFDGIHSVTDFYSDLVSNIKDKLESNNLWQILKTTIIVLVSAFGLLILFNIIKSFYNLIKKLFK